MNGEQMCTFVYLSGPQPGAMLQEMQYPNGGFAGDYTPAREANGDGCTPSELS